MITTCIVQVIDMWVQIHMSVTGVTQFYCRGSRSNREVSSLHHRGIMIHILCWVSSITRPSSPVPTEVRRTQNSHELSRAKV
jgi:hypothetical protein